MGDNDETWIGSKANHQFGDESGTSTGNIFITIFNLGFIPVYSGAGDRKSAYRIRRKNTSVQFEEKYSMMGSKFYSRNVNTEDDYVSPLDFLSTKEGGLDQYLLEQVKWLSISEGEKSILTYLIYNIDENGYLPMSNKEIEVQLDISPQEAEHAIKLLQGLEPLGVGARNLKECLLLQAQEYYPDESLVAYVIKNYLELLSEKKWKKISTELGISLLEVKKSMNIFRH